MKSYKNKIWIITAIVTLVLSILTFSPLVTPIRIFTPEIFGLPYTLWTGILMSFLMLLNTIVAIIFQPEK